MSNEVANYVLAVPFLSLILLLRRLHSAQGFVESPVRTGRADDVLGIGLILMALSVYWYGSHTFYPLEYHILSLPIFVSGLLALNYGRRTLQHYRGSILLLFFLVPIPIGILSTLGAELSGLSAWISFEVVRLLGIPFQLLNVYGTPMIAGESRTGETVLLAVTQACSGIYSLLGFSAFTAFVLSLTSGPIWKRIFLALLGFPVIYSLNLFRLVSVSSIAYYFGAGPATVIFHVIGAPILIFVGTLALILTGSKWGVLAFAMAIAKPIRSTAYTSSRPVKERHRISLRGLVRPIGVVLLGFMLLLVQVPVFAVTSGPAVVDLDSPYGWAESKSILPTLPGREPSFVLRDEQFEQVSGQDASLLYAYESSSGAPPIWVSLEIAPSRLRLHSWQNCLVVTRQNTGRPAATTLEFHEVKLWTNPAIVGNFFLFKQPNYNLTQAVLYWYESGTFRSGNSFETKFFQTSVLVFVDELREAGVISSTSDSTTIQSILADAARSIISYWQPIRTWSWISVWLAEQGVVVAAILGVILISISSTQILRRKFGDANTP